MKRIVATDIFGKTPAVHELCLALPGESQVISPYDDTGKVFTDESEAYSYFNHQVGLKRYTRDIENSIAGTAGPVCLLGFSMGASAIWHASEHLTSSKVTSAVCFYGSQIRKATEIKPGFPVTLVLPVSEPHFSVEALACRLTGRMNVILHQSRYQHGFMNRYSRHFHLAAYRHCLSWLAKDYTTIFRYTNEQQAISEPDLQQLN